MHLLLTVVQAAVLEQNGIFHFKFDVCLSKYKKKRSKVQIEIV